MAKGTQRTLTMRYSGRIIDQLGIQMYQSPVAAVAELVSNAWDADSEKVEITLPQSLDDSSEIIIKDNGLGMTFEDCEKRYLNVGYCRRGDDVVELSPEKKRPILGRKGIGKFAGFGIAHKISIHTISKETGEKTVFGLDLDVLRSGEYVTQGQTIQVQEYLEASVERIQEHGTEIRLKELKLGRRPSEQVFIRSMGRRFLLHRRSADFEVLVNGNQLHEGEDEQNIEYSFPRDYTDNERPESVAVGEDGWGVENVGDGRSIKWKIVFYQRPIDEEELRGVSVFSHGKLAQSPFFFNLTGGLGGQHGQEYVSGQVEADYLDEQTEDLIAPERQRVDFKNNSTIGLKEWGQNKLKELFRIWRDRRGAERVLRLEERINPFSARLENLPPSERKTVKRAITNLAKIAALEEDEFIELGNSMLTSWEGGRLKELISNMADSGTMSEIDFIHALMETEVLTALNIAEAVKTKIEAISGLKRHIERRTPENPLRDYIAKNPWLIAPKWETFRIERSVEKLMKDCAQSAGLSAKVYNGRIDLALSSGEHLLILEFMRPGLPVDLDHVGRYEIYVLQIREKIEPITGNPFRKVSGYLIADKLERQSGLSRKIVNLEKDDMLAADWDTLLKNALSEYREYLEILAIRSPEDVRLQSLLR